MSPPPFHCVKLLLLFAMVGVYYFSSCYTFLHCCCYYLYIYYSLRLWWWYLMAVLARWRSYWRRSWVVSYFKKQKKITEINHKLVIFSLRISYDKEISVFKLAFKTGHNSQSQITCSNEKIEMLTRRNETR